MTRTTSAVHGPPWLAIALCAFALLAHPVMAQTFHLTYDDEFNSISTENDDLWGDGGAQHGGAYQTWLNDWPYRYLQQDTLEEYVDPDFFGEPTNSGASLGVDPFSVSNGILSITANPSPLSTSYLDGHSYTSGMLTTNNTFSQEYGYFECRAEVPAGQGLWSAFWMLPTTLNQYNELAWLGEIDVMECFGSDYDYNGGSNQVHWATHDNGNSTNYGAWATVNGNIWNSYHYYGVLWNSSTITFYVDGVQIGKAPTQPDQQAPMFMLLNLALGADSNAWPGPVVSGDFPASFKIDSIRAYSSDPGAPAAAPQQGYLPNPALPISLGEAPFGGAAWSIPGTVDFDNYDTGGLGVGYYSPSPYDSGQYRSDNVGIDGSGDSGYGNGYDIGWIAGGEWLKYAVDVASAGTYTASFRVAGGTSGGTFHLLDANGNDLTGEITVPYTGSYHTWTTVTANVPLAAGNQVLTAYVDTPGFNLNCVTFSNGGGAPPGPTGLSATGSNASVDLTWNSSAGATSYNVYRGTAPGADSATPIATSVAATTYTDTSVSDGTTYYYTVSAVNGSGTSGYSNEGVATPIAMSLTLTSWPSGPIDLNTEGTAGWTQWGGTNASPSTTAWNTNAGSPFSNYTEIGSFTPTVTNNLINALDWTSSVGPNGTGSDPDWSGAGIQCDPAGDGFQFTVSTGSSTRTLRIYVAAWYAQGQLTVLDGNGGTVYQDSSVNDTNGSVTPYEYIIPLEPGPNDSSATYTIEWTALSSSSGNLILQGADLQ